MSNIKLGTFGVVARLRKAMYEANTSVTDPFLRAAMQIQKSGNETEAKAELPETATREFTATEGVDEAIKQLKQ